MFLSGYRVGWQTEESRVGSTFKGTYLDCRFDLYHCQVMWKATNLVVIFLKQLKFLRWLLANLK